MQSNTWRNPVHNSVGSNPHPARRLDAMFGIKTRVTKTGVPILIQPEDWMQLNPYLDLSILGEVPILIQPEDWMQSVITLLVDW